ncbi:hypothetical protein [Oceanicaulis sp.]|uniref:hypothetical protein n=1 Tax=Oceanicaulis sp. TaxID=1924941 RepID=UPI003D2A50B4
MDWDWVSSIIGFLGGASAIGAAFTFSAKSLVNYHADKRLKEWQNELDHSLERARASLRREEFLYNMQVEAAKEFLRIYNEIDSFRTHPSIDYSEMIFEFSFHLGTLENKLIPFMNKYESIIPDSIGTKIWDLIHQSNEVSLHLPEIDRRIHSLLSSQHENAVGGVWSELRRIRSDLKNLVWTDPGNKQSS